MRELVTFTYLPWDPDSSALIAFLPHLVSSIENIAPEKRTELQRLSSRVSFIIDDHPGFVFRARGATDPREIRSSIIGLELLWCLAYAHTLIYQAAPRQTDLVPAQPSQNVQAAADVLTFALNDRATHTSPKHALPQGIPTPEFATLVPGVPVGDLHLATELFLCAAAWLLHHELGHVALDHLDHTIPAPKDELEADNAATTWILDGAPAETVLKRGLGVGLALLALGAVGLGKRHGSLVGSSYPPTGERIMRALTHPVFGNEHQVHDFTSVGLRVHLEHKGIMIPNLPNAFDSLHASCQAVSNWELGR